jgi:multidrug efflux pump subunit AcrB
MGGIVSWWARNTVAANLAMVGIWISGILAFFTLEREVFPTFPINWVEVSVVWRGAAPQEIEEQIIIRIEESVADLDSVQRIRAIALEGVGQVFIETDPRVDIAKFINEVKLRVDSISTLPSDIEPPRVREILTRNELIRVAVSGSADERTLKRVAERARDEIALLPGASIVELFGARAEEVSIEVSEESLRRYGLTFDEVVRAIRNTSVNLSSGNVRTQTGDIQLRARNLADTREDFEKIVVRQTPDGATIRIGDVATVTDGFEDVNLLATLNGEPAVLVQVMTQEKMNVVKTSESVQKWLEKPKDWLPDGVELTMWFDSSKIYFDRMGTISRSAVMGLLLVFLVLIATLRPKVAVWVTVGIATAFAGAFIFLPSNDVSLNMLSLFAFLLVIGIVVDDAIIVGESIHRQVEQGGQGVDAAILGTQLVLKPVIFAVFTTIIAFAPWLFLSGAQVQVTRHISIIVICALAFSLLEALLILPAHLSNLKERTKKGRFARFQSTIADGLVHFAQTYYRPLVRWAVYKRYLTTSIFIAVFLLSIGLIQGNRVGLAFFPEVEDEQIVVQVTLPEGMPYSRALEILEQLQKAEKQLEEEVNARAKKEGGSGELIANWYTRARDGSVLAIVQLAPPEVRDLSAKEAAERLRELIGEIPDAEEIVLNYTINQRDPGLQFSVNAPDLDILQLAVDALKAKLDEYDSVYNVTDSLRRSTDEIQLVLKPGAEQLGLTLADISRQLRQAYYGQEVQRLPREGNDVRVMVRYPREARRSLDSLQDFRLRTADGRQVPLSAVADIEFAPGLKRIDRRERQRSAVVSAEVTGDTSKQIMKDLNESFFPDWMREFPGVSRGAIGVAEAEQQFMQEVSSLYLVALLTMYALLAIAFRSYWLPLLIMTAIPFGFMGAVFGHYFYGMSIVLFSYFGIGAAAGVVVNDNLVLVDYVNRLRDQGMGALDALVEAGVTRFRPILLTSVTTFVGLVPMMAEQSTQAKFLQPMVTALAYGVAFATFVTLLFVPALYGIGVDMGRFFRWYPRAFWAALRGREIPPRLPRLGEGKGSVR